uniref:NADH-ubiquinone oxidoreductase chain 4 n=1 Tax=Nomada fabriciana TaxID=601510 RepID=A0A0S2LTI2_9HYME|nr:NADH dehydrogenase subunit 4 [Nomada fabriciana]
MLMELMFLMFYLFYLILNCNLYFISSLMFMYSIFMFMKLSYLNWWLMNFSFSFNLYSFSLVILIFWIMSLIIMNLKFEILLNKCLILLNLMSLIMILNFMSMNFLLFYYMFEISLLMIYYLILNWSYGKFKILSSYLLMFYTLFFSLPMFIIIVYLKMKMNSLSFLIMELKLLNLSKFMLIYLLLSFLIKIPMFLIHNWLLKAHVEAPFFGSMILAAIMLKLGGYGLIRMMMMFFYLMLNNFIIISLNLIGLLFLSLMCLRQIDMKILVAMSSIIHMGLMISSMFLYLKISFLGSYLMMLSHGLTSSGLFYLINIIYQQTKTRLMIINKGMIMFMPTLSLMWFLMCSSNMAAPFSLNLVSEIFLLTSLMIWMKFLILILMFYCLLSFIYSIYLFSYIQHGFIESLNHFFYNGKFIMFLTLMFHWLPLNLLILNLNVIIYLNSL